MTIGGYSIRTACPRRFHKLLPLLLFMVAPQCLLVSCGSEQDSNPTEITVTKPAPKVTVDPSISNDLQTDVPDQPRSLGAAPQYETEAELIKRKLDELSSGNILFNPPEQMTLDKKERIEIRLATDRVSEKDLAEGLVGEGEPRIETIKIGTFMKVQLCCGPPEEGHAFDIVALNSSEQIVTDTRATQWSFDVTPRKRGLQRLTLTVTVRLNLPDGKEEKVDHPLIERPIRVNVTTTALLKSWLTEHWQWLASTLLIPLVVVLWRFARKSQQRSRRTAAVQQSEKSDGNGVFISYRRDDSKWFARSLNETLSSTLGDKRVFIDVADIDLGVDFTQAINDTLQKCKVLVAIIGEHWLSASNDQGRRIDDPDDYVRLEIATALKRNIRVIPVLVENASMPLASDLPEEIKALAHRNAIQLSHANFEDGAKRLTDTLKSVLS